ncbi:MAG: heavy metal-responsive transcriptional regulator [Armatimonadota bacterium]|nr:heavy metal-responsive transcriptional regulator [Armatimonadota bacterium]MDR7459632.1 heavy metal-responsive transcriptional regulator [Armatimonadota bacterium]MDR7480572.1 heavy metal-responsive transcriptional regulator [Armatimonadota bacterium]MDR7489268.1 heavy metal-responsive transcriptional regulator [Armatimonadota bacterium]MDR7502858.1 heavy metal-responsive transcriptional regulator [Armatimonadota bacterium]
MLTIGRLGNLAGLEAKTLRYYDRVGLVRPSGRTAAGYRMYEEDTVNRLHFIRRAKALGMSLADIRRILAVRDEGAAPCEHVLALVTDNLTKVEGQIAQLERIRGDLRRLRRLLKAEVSPGVRTVEECPCFAIIQSFQKPVRSLNSGRTRVRGISGWVETAQPKRPTTSSSSAPERRPSPRPSGRPNWGRPRS